MEDGALLNRYWDDNDTPRPESWLDDVTTAKNNPNRPATEIYRDLRSAAASGWDFSSRWMDDPKNWAPSAPPASCRSISTR
jgi:alpha,alpha-trehalase